MLLKISHSKVPIKGLQAPCIMYKFIKRTFDILAASLALILLSPVYLIVAAKLATNLGTPVIFNQQRPGLHGKTFTMKKI
jgi:lipopolysaccharide/colanic/teichoic acid biosynthesis glycosyltransferase